MKQVIINAISMHYFKGVENRRIEFGKNETNISGPNGSGKSTVIDAFFWCLWGKNAAGRSDFSIKTVDRDGIEIPNVDHEVVVELSIDDERQEFKRVFIPEYNKEGRLKGNHTDYFWNDVPCKKSEYDAKVSAVISEDVFKLITSPTAFMGMDWQSQRDMLIRMAGDICNEEVGDGRFSALCEILKSKNLEEVKRELNAKIKRVNDAMKDIPARVDEVKRGMPESPDMSRLKEERVEIESRLSAIENEEKDLVAAYNAGNDVRIALTNKISDLKFKQQQVLNESQAKERNEIHASNQTYLNAEQEYNLLATEEKNDAGQCKMSEQSIQREIDFGHKLADNKEKELVSLREEWSSVNAGTFEADEYLKCPLYGHVCGDGQACSRYDQDQSGAFNTWKQKKDAKLADIQARGKEIANELTDIKKGIEERQDEIKELKDGYSQRSQNRLRKAEELSKVMHNNPKRPLISSITIADVEECVKIGEEIKELETKLLSMGTNAIDLPHADEKKSLNQRLDVIKLKENYVEMINKGAARITELQDELKKLGEEKMDLEDRLQECTDFEIERMNMVSDKVNGLFELVKWQMWQQQVNGDIVPACLCLCDGVIWKDANQAKKINAGIEVASKIASSFGVSAPIFLDNAESIGKIYVPDGVQMIFIQFDRNKTEFEYKIS